MPTNVPTGFVAHPDSHRHDPGPEHPDRPDRVQMILATISSSGLLKRLRLHEPEMARRADIERVHPPAYVERVGAALKIAPTVLDEQAVIVAGTLRAARLSVGGAIEASERVLRGEWKNAFVACRPPGHLAEPTLARGHCIFNQAAIAARVLRDRLGVERVAIVDFDAQPGLGTQRALAGDRSFFYASVHESDPDPDSRACDDFTRNCPLAPRSGEREWLAAIHDEIAPALRRFAPQFLLLSAGFGAHHADRSSTQELTTESYRHLTAACVALADERCDGRLVSLLEGGYELGSLAASVAEHLEVLNGGQG